MRRTVFYAILLLLPLLTEGCSSLSDRPSVDSPSGDLRLSVMQSAEGDFCYTFEADGVVLIDSSLLGYRCADGRVFPSAEWSVSGVERSSYRGVWQPLWGKRRLVEDCYNETNITFELSESNVELRLTLRAYDDGVAWCYAISGSDDLDDLTIESEATQFNFAGDYMAWFYNKEHANVTERLSQSGGVRMPVMTIQAAEDRFMAIHEAYLRGGEPLLLRSQKGSTLFEVASKPQAISSDFESPWRVIFSGRTPGAMVDSHLLELLNPDPAPEMDFSWVRPGVALWDWRIDGAQVEEFTYSMSYPSWVKMVDFAAEQGLSYLVLDANWYGPEFDKSSDPLVGDKAQDVRRIIEYAREREVGVWLYLNDVGGRQYPIEQTLKQYGEWGAAGVKYGFMRGNTAQKLERTQLITRLCAENRLLVNYHDAPVHPYGQMRTWPNAVTREYCHAQLDAHRVFVPETFVTSVFVNMLAGPIDMNNGMFDLRQGHTDRVDESQPVPSTLVSEAARTAIVFSGATILPDIPEFYRKYPSLLRFISAQRMPWVESRTLSGVIGEHIVMMRESEDHYLVAAAINEAGGRLTIPMDFLPAGEFKAELTTDGEGAHYLTNREVLSVAEIVVSCDQPITVELAPGGGCCLLIDKN